ncbi:MAG: 3-oxoacyl-[acyl-carrier-protein] reductase [Parachlamydiales bacterium]|jgi:3-oxoacyl-[acyl-carrier protein] reductase
MHLPNQIAVVTGATSGIGKAIAALFYAEGASVVLIGTQEEKAKAALEEMAPLKKTESQKLLFKLLDVADTSAVEQAFSAIYQELGQVDILVNSAGITRDNFLFRISEEDWDRVLAVNLKAVFNTCRQVYRPMMKKRKGKIINISSVIGLTGNAGQANYAASKAGMIALTKSLALELARKNVCVNAIAPGFIQTQMTEVLPDEIKKGILAKIPFERYGTPEEVARLALFLASDASNYITGQVINVDGGMVML